MTYEQALRLWLTHDPFKRASAELIKAIQNKPYEDALL
jgi:hypothetical protein